MNHRFVKEIDDFNGIPHGWGIGWIRYGKRTKMCFPIPFNFALGWGRNIYYRLMRGPRRQLEDSIIASMELTRKQIYEQGLRDGRNNSEWLGS